MTTYDEVKEKTVVPTPDTKADTSSVPEPKNHLTINQAELDKWISEEPDPQFKKIKQKIADNLAIVPHEVFKSALKSCTEGLNKQLAGREYAVLWDYKPHASKRWVYEQIKNDLTTPPTAETYFGAYDAMEDYESFRELLDRGIDTFVVTDDAIYSGEQFKNATLKKLIEVYKKFGYYPTRKPHIVLMAPYMTTGFKENEITKQAQEQGIVSLVSEYTMPTLNEILSEADKEALSQRDLSFDLPEQKKPRTTDDPNEDRLFYKATLTAFDHRVADGHSFCEPVSYRLGLDAPKPYADPSSDYYQKEEAEFAAYQNQRSEKAA